MLIKIYHVWGWQEGWGGGKPLLAEWCMTPSDECKHPPHMIPKYIPVLRNHTQLILNSHLPSPPPVLLGYPNLILLFTTFRLSSFLCYLQVLFRLIRKITKKKSDRATIFVWLWTGRARGLCTPTPLHSSWIAYTTPLYFWHFRRMKANMGKGWIGEGDGKGGEGYRGMEFFITNINIISDQLSLNILGCEESKTLSMLFF